MTILDNDAIKHIHCMGIGGIGVSGLAEILLAKGFAVSGSDVASNKNVKRLQALGANITTEHCVDNVTNADMMIYSSAISQQNPEFLAAQAKGVPLLKRGQLLAELLNVSTGIAVSGTHGKTTTSGIITHCLLTAGSDPTYVVGGILNNLESPAHLGAGQYFVAEADESDASFLYLSPKIVVLTNIDADHLSTYGGNFETLKKAFIEFCNKVPADGFCVLNIDDPIVRSIVPQLTSRLVTVGFSEDADYRASDFSQAALVSHFTVSRKDRAESDAFTLALAGLHNVSNALAAVALAHEIQLPIDAVQKGFASFPGMGRRMNAHPPIQLATGSVDVFEDYGHHPNEVKATLDAAKAAWPDRRVVLVFQPHRYTRTHDLFDEFATVLSDAESLVLLDVYSAGEGSIASATGEALCRAIQSKNKVEPIFVADLNALPSTLKTLLQAGDVVLLQGAGSVGAIAATLFETI